MSYDNLFTRLVANTHEPDESAGSDSCWLWKSNTDEKGYGRFSARVNGKYKKVRAIRAMAQLMRGENEFDLDDDPLGPIIYFERPALDPDLETVDHTCWNTGCINPSHLRLMTRSQNTTLRNQRKRS